MRKITVEEFDELMDNWTTILLYFHWDVCPKCSMLTLELEKVEWQMRCPLYASNAQAMPELAHKLWVSSIPYLILMHKWIKIKEYWDVNTWDFILDYFWIRIPEDHDHDQELEEVLDSNE